LRNERQRMSDSLHAVVLCDYPNCGMPATQMNRNVKQYYGGFRNFNYCAQHKELIRDDKTLDAGTWHSQNATGEFPQPAQRGSGKLQPMVGRS